jgi:hypothetical protein
MARRSIHHDFEELCADVYVVEKPNPPQQRLTAKKLYAAFTRHPRFGDLFSEHGQKVSLRKVEEWKAKFVKRDLDRGNDDDERWTPWRDDGDVRPVDTPEETAFLLQLDWSLRLNFRPSRPMTRRQARWGKRLRPMLEGEPAGYQAVLVDLYAKRELACQLLGVPVRTDDFDAWMAYCELCKSVGDGITLRQAGEGLVAKRILGEYADAVTRMLSMLESAGITRPEAVTW